MKRCPTCSELLMRRRVTSVEVDGCPGCGGLWLDRGELKALSEDPSHLREAGKHFKPVVQQVRPEATHACPACQQTLTPFEYDRFRGIRLDRCKACGGVWLDHGEAQAIAQRLEAEGAAPAVSPAPVAAGSGLELAEDPRAPQGPLPDLVPPPRPDYGFGPAPAAPAGTRPQPSTLQRKHLFVAAGVLLVGLLLYLALRQRLVEVGDDAAGLPFVTQQAQRLTFGDYGGRVVFVRFSSGGGVPFDCPNVRRAASNERALQKRFAEEVAFVDVSIGQTPPAKAGDEGWEVVHYAEVDLYHQFFEREGSALGLTKSYSFPSYVVLGRDGRVAYVNQGNQPLATFEEVVTSALASP